METKKRISVIGLGYGDYISNVIENNNKAELVAVVDINRMKLDRIQSKCKKFSSLSDYLKSDIEQDMVIISTPNTTHIDILDKISKSFSNLTILVEKPAFQTSKEYLTALEIIEKGKLDVYVHHSFKCHPFFQKIVEALKTIKSQDIYKIKFSTYQKVGLDINNKYSWYHNKEMGGGQVNMMGTHILDAVMYLMNSNDIEKKFLYSGIVNDKRVDKNGIKRLVNAEEWFDVSFLINKKILLEISNTTYSEVNDIEISIFTNKGIMNFYQRQDEQFSEGKYSLFSYSFEYLLNAYVQDYPIFKFSNIQRAYYIYKLLNN